MMTTSFSSAPPPPSTSRSLLVLPSSHLKLPPRLLLHGRSTLSCSAAGTNNGPPPAGDSVPKQVPFCPFSSFIQVDPIVASFSGGGVGVISTLMLIEVNNVKQQEKKRCKYCLGTGYLPCAKCSASGVCLTTDPIKRTRASSRLLQAPTTESCVCSCMNQVMCPTCLCTGMVTASEHDPRFDPFD
ncbi:hypothetical protein F2Q70_00014084 [Brassica cretica]|uniref:Uncharacterized protein n=1 Tax=Brassica cretica TaxID=69181 RepID=A0A8S9I2B5_BRACR|nr:hypothetical protein F2Q70_00014084 [Brassica cretica]